MTRKILSGIILFVCCVGFSIAQTEPPAPCGPVASENQLKWQELEYYAVIHFSLNNLGYAEVDIITD